MQIAIITITPTIIINNEKLHRFDLPRYNMLNKYVGKTTSK